MPDTLERLRTALADAYAVEREIGRGGMATVYLAEDRKHARRVAIKVLRPDLAAALGDERFLREVQLTAQLRHPHILPLLDSGAADGLLYYVMPFVEGESVRDRLNRERQLPVDDAVKIATEVLSALSYAHRHDVVHRDIKPENILLESGHAVVADFGVARAIDAAGGTQLTATGMAVGTPAYMSPEQATGEGAPDGRSDLYSLGCVLYEMLVGEPPYTGPTVQAITARKLVEPAPSVRRVRETVPQGLADVIDRLLARLPADRYATAPEVVEDLRRCEPRGGRPPERAVPASAAAPRPGMVTLPKWLAWTAAAIVTVLGGLAVRGWVAPSKTVDAAPTRLSVLLPEGIRMLRLPGPAIALSPDGRTLAVVGFGPDGRRLYLRRLDALEAEALEGTEGAASPFFSPDGVWIGFYADGLLKRVPTLGGVPTVITEAPGEPLGASWGADDRIVFTSGYRSGLSRVAAEGGTPEALTVLDTAAGEVSHRLPDLLPTGHAVVFTVLSAQGWRIAVQNLATGRRATVDGFEMARYAQSGHLVLSDAYRAAATLFGAAFDAGGLSVGTPRSLVENVATTNALAQYALSRNGTLAYLPGSPNTILVLVDASGVERTVPLEGDAFAHPRFSPDGTRLAVGVLRNGQSDIWLYDLAGGAPSRLTFDGAASPVWSPDGKAVAFGTGPFIAAGEARGIRMLRVDGRGGEQPVADLPGTNWHALGDWTADGDTIVFDESREGSVVGISLAAAGTTSPLLESTGLVLRGGRVSPDGHWIAYQSDESGEAEIYLTTFPQMQGRWQVSVDGGADPVWARDGSALYYVSDDRLMAATVAFEPTVRISDHRVVQGVFAPSWYGDYDVRPDRGGFVLARAAGAAVQREVVVVLNWFDELERLVPQ